LKPLTCIIFAIALTRTIVAERPARARLLEPAAPSQEPSAKAA
jgi:hypothetical protein